MSNARHESQLIDRVMSAAKRHKTPPPAPADNAKDFDFSVPCCFGPGQLQQLADAAVQMASAVSAALTKELRGPVQLAAGPISQHYLGTLREATWEEPVFCVPLTLKGPLAGMLVLSGRQARAWVGTLLGGGASAPPADRPLSSLEASLVFDVVRVLTETIGACRSRALAMEFTEQLFDNCRAIAGQDSEEWVRFSWSLEGSAGQPAIVMLLPAEAVGPLAGWSTQRPTSEQSRQAMLSHVQRAAVGLQVMLGQARLTMGELAQLESGDVLLLDRRADEPIDVLVGGKRLWLGRPAASRGQYAVQVVSTLQTPG